MENDECHAANCGRRGVVVSVHDVSPRNWRRVDAMLVDLASWGVGQASLLVIPDHHGRGRIGDDPEFCEWLTARVIDGHEVVAHGYHHLRERSVRDGYLKRLTTEHYTAGEGEFHDLAAAAAAELLERGLAEFARIGLRPTGFIAPAWLLGADAEGAVRAAGFRYTTRIGTVEDFPAGRVYRSRSLVYSVRSGWRRVCSLGWNEGLSRALTGSALVRMGLHPPDWDFPAIRSHVRKCLRRALASREAITYDAWLDRQAIPTEP